MLTLHVTDWRGRDTGEVIRLEDRGAEWVVVHRGVLGVDSTRVYPHGWLVDAMSTVRRLTKGKRGRWEA